MSLAWASGEVVTAAKLNRNNPIVVRKGSDESVSSATTGTTFQNDDALVVPLVAGRSYRIELNVAETANTAGDIKLDWTTTGTITLLGQRFCQGPAVTMTSPSDTTVRAARATTLATSVSYGGAATAGYIRETFEVSCTVSGDLQLRWAQDTSNAGNTTVIAGSWISATPID